MDLSQLSALLAQHQWLAALALFITALVRLLKSDTPLPLTIAPRWRAWIALGLGVVGGALDALVAGTPFLAALLQGLGAGALAITAHDTLVEGIRGGRDWFASPKNGTKLPGSGAGRTGTAAGFVLVVGLAFLVGSQPACTPEVRTAARTAVDIASVSCVVLRVVVEDGTVQEICATEAELAPLVKRLLAARASARAACPVPGGQP